MGSLLTTSLITAFWLFFVVTGRDGGLLFRGYRVDAVAVGRVLGGFLFMTVLWGWLWYGVKRRLLRRRVGLSPDEMDSVFRSRMGTPFDLRELLRVDVDRWIVETLADEFNSAVRIVNEKGVTLVEEDWTGSKYSTGWIEDE